MAMIANGIDRTSPQYIPPAMSAPFEAEAIRTFGIKICPVPIVTQLSASTYKKDKY